MNERIGESQLYHYVNVNMYDILFKERVSVRENARERKIEKGANTC